ncbi:prolyl endopeptidase isoform X1 [Amyelois transitella]|uniref:prolyl endopeptidase isoform X1 n=2 Tax=Amyelois transitella TaxID=680683 RepID=UPI00298FF854|nr:prolyl endopeptidase isoform X1 [Amyelois transitella]
MSLRMAVRPFFANHSRIWANYSLFLSKQTTLTHQISYKFKLAEARQVLCVCASTSSAPRTMSFEYPEARRDETVVDDYHGTLIKDPYRWLEDPDSNETKEFIEAENKITRPYLNACPVKDDIHERLTELWNYPKYSCPFRRGDRYFFFKNTGLQNQNVLYVQDSLDGEARVFLDPNTLSEDGTIALSGSRFTEDGATFAYGLSASGSDWITIHLKDVATGKDYPEVLEKVKFASMSWTKDHKGLFYSRYPDQTGKTDGSETEVNRDQKLCFHRLNTPQKDDVIVVEFPEEPLWRIGAEVTDCGKYLIVTPVRDCRDNLLFFAELNDYNVTGKLPLTQIVHKFEADYEYITNEGSVCIFRTNKNAPNYRLIKIDLRHPHEDNWQTLIPEHPTDVLDWASAVDGDKLVIHYVRDVKSVLQLHSAETGDMIQTFDLPVGSVVGFSGKKEQTEIFYHFMSFLTPGVIYHVDLSKKPYDPTVFREVKVKGFDGSQYEAKQVFYSSKDGTKVPMFIVSKKDLPRDGSNPALVYGYGGFNINIQPSFSVTRVVFMQHFNGVVAIPNIRGGGEYGERWHNAGRLLNKQNVFDDFQAAAEYLIAEKYTKPSLITIQGGSNGGLLVAACINQRPDLYGAAIVQVGVLDMLRFQKFTIGHAWTSDYGSSDNETQFRNLIKYSPLHNIHVPDDERPEYPATLVLTADHDDRVVPLHSLKFIAALQHAARNSRQKRPLLARVDTKAGHGGGKPTTKIIDENTDILCFMTQALGLKFVK